MWPLITECSVVTVARDNRAVSSVEIYYRVIIVITDWIVSRFVPELHDFFGSFSQNHKSIRM